MIYEIKAPYFVNVCIDLPKSKSISARALIMNALCAKPTRIVNLAQCDDTDVMVSALDAALQHDHASTIDIGAAGTAMRFLTAYLATQPGEWILTGTERMRNRPIGLLVDALRSIGADIEYVENDGFPPLRIMGKKLIGGEISLDGSVSSQYISALLMIAPVMTEGLRLSLTGEIISKPYIDLTVKMMQQFGIETRVAERSITVPPGKYHAAQSFEVESDWSAASYWYEIAAISRDSGTTIELLGLREDSLQGDAAIVKLFDLLGVKSTFTPKGVILTLQPNSFGYQLFCYDFLAMPDIAQTAVATCVALNVKFVFTGLQSLKIKETDRLHALKVEFEKFGVPLMISDNDCLEWSGFRLCRQPSPVIETYEDHRMAMAFAPLALLRYEEGIRINNPGVVTKSYPAYWDDLRLTKFIINEL